MSDIRNRHAVHRAACAEAVAEIAKHDMLLARSAARVLGVSMHQINDIANLLELDEMRKQRRRSARVWLVASIALAAFLAWTAAPDLAAWFNGQPPITGEKE